MAEMSVVSAAESDFRHVYRTDLFPSAYRLRFPLEKRATSRRIERRIPSEQGKRRLLIIKLVYSDSKFLLYSHALLRSYLLTPILNVRSYS